MAAGKVVGFMLIGIIAIIIIEVIGHCLFASQEERFYTGDPYVDEQKEPDGGSVDQSP